MPTEVVRYVDTGATGAGTGLNWQNAYTSLAAWNAAEKKDLVTADEYQIVKCRAKTGVPDTVQCCIEVGWVTNATHYIKIIGHDFPPDGIFNPSRYYLLNNSLNSWYGILTVKAKGYIWLSNLQMQVNGAAGQVRIGLTLEQAIPIYADSLIIRVNAPVASTTRGIQFYYSGSNLYLSNAIIYNPAAQIGWGIARATGELRGYNCIVYGLDVGVYSPSPAFVNSAVGNCLDNFDGVTGVDYCMSDLGEGTNPRLPKDGDWNNEFRDIAKEDFRMKAGGNLKSGTTDPGSGLYDWDITKKKRVPPWGLGGYDDPTSGFFARQIVQGKPRYAYTTGKCVTRNQIIT